MWCTFTMNCTKGRGLTFAEVIRLGEAKRVASTTAATRARAAKARAAFPAIVPVACKPAVAASSASSVWDTCDLPPG
jgi:hypothetical protein